MPNSSKHANDVTFTEESLIAFIKKIKNDINNWDIKTGDRVGEIKYRHQNGTTYTNVTINGFTLQTDSSDNSLYSNFTNSQKKGENGKAYVWTDILYAYNSVGESSYPIPKAYINNLYGNGNIGASNTPFTNGYFTNIYGTNLGSSGSPWTNAFITNLGSSGKPVENAYIKNLNITSGGTITGTPTFSGALTITDTTEATRTVPDSYGAQTPPDSYFNITNSGIRLTSTDQTYYVPLTSGGYEAANTSTVYPSGTTFYTRSDSYNGGNSWASSSLPGGGYYYGAASPSTTVVNSSKTFKNNSYASQYYTKSGNTYTVCNTSTNYLNVQLYYNNGADPALGINYSSTMVLVGSIKTNGGIAAGKSIKGYRVHAAVFNDYAEYRQTDSVAPGRCVTEVGDGNMILSTKRLQPGANIVSDTFGFSIGETILAQTPIAVCGRVLAYPFEDKEVYEPGDAVCSGPNGTISKMTREEIKEWPDRIVGYVSEIPTYKYWGSDKVEVNGRIWIKIK